MSPTQKAAEIRHLKSEASSAKGRLMDILRHLERIEARRDARGLSSIIGKLEDWQNR